MEGAHLVLPNNPGTLQLPGGTPVATRWVKTEGDFTVIGLRSQMDRQTNGQTDGGRAASRPIPLGVRKPSPSREMPSSISPGLCLICTVKTATPEEKAEAWHSITPHP